jgi:hypothetical protein
MKAGAICFRICSRTTTEKIVRGICQRRFFGTCRLLPCFLRTSRTSDRRTAEQANGSNRPDRDRMLASCQSQLGRHKRTPVRERAF